MKYCRTSKYIAFLSAAALSWPIISSAAPKNTQSPYQSDLLKLEKKYQSKLGVYAIDTANGNVVAYKEQQAFPFESTFKFMTVAALLYKMEHTKQKTNFVSMRLKDLVPWSPVSALYIGKKVSLDTLAMAALTYSDNGAINAILNQMGGVKPINQFARGIGNNSFNLEHYEIKLNSNPTKKQDSSTPKDMALSIQKVLLGNVLSKNNQGKIINWMKSSTTGYKRIRAGIPLGWSVADKTGSGSFGVANDIGIAWMPACRPIVLSIYSNSANANTKPNDALVAEATQVIMKHFKQSNSCFSRLDIPSKVVNSAG
jgi:beta-lactamase class A